MILRAALLAHAADGVPPLTPDGDQARRWAEQELAYPVYDAARPTPIDRIAQAVGDFIGRLFGSQLSGGWAQWAALVAAIVVIILIIAAFLIWGRPRTTTRGRPAVALLFGEPEARSADQLRRDAAAAAERAEWDDAIVLRFRALARGLLERGIVDGAPGVTVHGFARSAGRALPSCSASLDAAAAVFDDVRYLRRPGTGELYRRVVDVDESVVRARPTLLERAGVLG